MSRLKKQPETLQMRAERLNTLAAEQRELERRQVADFEAFSADYVAAVRADGEADVEIPDITPGQRQALEARTRGALQDFEREPALQAHFRRQRELDEANRARLSAA
jgi:hypothetical protein